MQNMSDIKYVYERVNDIIYRRQVNDNHRIIVEYKYTPAAYTPTWSDISLSTHNRYINSNEQ